MSVAWGKSVPIKVCLCGSTRFKDAFVKANRDETLQGKIVLTVGLFGHEEGLDMDGPVKAMLDALHLEKIRASDEILVLNVGGYVGKSTRREIAFARVHGKVVRYLEPPAKPAKAQTLVFDVDEVLCVSSDESVPYYERAPYPHAVRWLAYFAACGFTIILQTARGMDRFEGNLVQVEAYHRPLLERWLEEWGVPYDWLAFGKQVGCVYADDLGWRVESKRGEEDWESLARHLGVGGVSPV